MILPHDPLDGGVYRRWARCPASPYWPESDPPVGRIFPALRRVPPPVPTPSQTEAISSVCDGCARFDPASGQWTEGSGTDRCGRFLLKPTFAQPVPRRPAFETAEVTDQTQAREGARYRRRHHRRPGEAGPRCRRPGG